MNIVICSVTILKIILYCTKGHNHQESQKRETQLIYVSANNKKQHNPQLYLYCYFIICDFSLYAATVTHKANKNVAIIWKLF